MIDIAELLGHMDEIVERAVIGDESCNVLMECRDRIAEQFGYSWCDNHEEWVTGGISAERAWCLDCEDRAADASEAARDDEMQKRADAAREAGKINRHLWSLGGGRAPLIIIAAWSMMAACVR